MPKLSSDKLPKYRKHRVSGQAVVTLDGKDFYLGPHGTKASRTEYDRLVGEWQSNGRRLPTSNGAADTTINELVLAYWQHAEQHYRKDGEPTDEIHGIRSALRPLKRLYGDQLAREFGPIKLKTIRHAMIQENLCRNSINQHVGRIRRMFKWAVEDELVPPDVFHGLQAVSGLRRGRSDARESKRVTPVPPAFVEAVLPHVAPQVAAMIRLQELTGMRPGEAVIVRTCDLDTSGRLWTYRPASHKTEHHGHERLIYLGPQAQAVVKSWLKTDLQAYLFSPAEVVAALNERKRVRRKTPLYPSHVKRQERKRRRKPKRMARTCYTVDSYRRAISYGIEQANKGIEDETQKIPHWHPHQLRHNAATRLRKEYGIEAARVILGHRSPLVTEIYAEVDRTRAAEIMLQVG